MQKYTRYVIVCILAVFTAVLLIPFARAQEEDPVGTGVLYVYVDSARNTEAPKGGPHGDTYFVTIGITYYIRVLEITENEFNTGDLITVKIGWNDTSGTSQTTWFTNVPIQESGGVKYVDVDWSVPLNAKICTTATVHYRKDSGPDYVARGQISTVGHMHIIPQTLLGTIGAILALFAGLGLYLLPKKNKLLRQSKE